jgi:hypothetical protein
MAKTIYLTDEDNRVTETSVPSCQIERYHVKDRKATAQSAAVNCEYMYHIS